MKNIKCILGIHHWIYFYPKRYCLSCHKYEIAEYTEKTGGYKMIKMKYNEKDIMDAWKNGYICGALSGIAIYVLYLL